MSDDEKEKTYKSSPGPQKGQPTLRILLSKRPREGQERQQSQPQEDEGGVESRRPTDELLIAPKKGITFYDLGTRLRSVPPGQVFNRLRVRAREEITVPVRNDADGYFNEYVEIEYEWPAPVPDRFPTPVINRPPTLEEVQALDHTLLGSRTPGSEDQLDPFGFSTANGSGRKIPNAMPLPFFKEEAEVSPLRTKLHTFTGVVWVNDDRHLLNENTQVNPPYKKRGPQGRDAQERWNPHNLEESVLAYPVAHAQGTLKPPGAKVKGLAHAPDFQSLSIPFIPHYEMFDTRDVVNYKVTSEPSYEADEVSLALNNMGQIRVYLKPRIVGYVLMHETKPRTVTQTFPTPTAAVWGRYPYDAPYAADAVALHPNIWSCFALRSKIFGPLTGGGLNPSINRRPRNRQSSVEYSFDDNASIPGALAGVVAQKGRVWYVWRKTTLDLDRRDLIGVDFNDPANAGLEPKIFSSWSVGFRTSGGDIGQCEE